MTRSLFIVFIVPLMGVGILVAACASSERLSVSEYAEFCAEWHRQRPDTD